MLNCFIKKIIKKQKNGDRFILCHSFLNIYLGILYDVLHCTPKIYKNYLRHMKIGNLFEIWKMEKLRRDNVHAHVGVFISKSKVKIIPKPNFILKSRLLSARKIWCYWVSSNYLLSQMMMLNEFEGNVSMIYLNNVHDLTSTKHIFYNYSFPFHTLELISTTWKTFSPIWLLVFFMFWRTRNQWWP